MTRSPVVVAVLERDNAVLEYRNVMGATDPKKADAGTIRKLFGANVGENAVHGSDSLDNAKNEIAYFFRGLRGPPTPWTRLRPPSASRRPPRTDERHRPGYPLELVESMGETCRTPPGAFGARPPRVVDLGCGTGFSARCRRVRGTTSWGSSRTRRCVERGRAWGALATWPVVRRRPACRTHFGHLSPAAQAFHWFDVNATMKEILRLAPKGAAAPSGTSGPRL